MAVHRGDAATMPSTEFRLTSTDGLRVAGARWDSRGPVRGVVQIAHGMGEHIGRYVGTIEVLQAISEFGQPTLNYGHEPTRDHR
jgi:alpha-beta hydrolase superfamily lysophospholipase